MKHITFNSRVTIMQLKVERITFFGFEKSQEPADGWTVAWRIDRAGLPINN